MILTSVYDLSKDYNMMLNKNVIDCFEENEISQETISDIINNYNLEQNNIDGDYDKFCFQSNDNETSTVNETSSTLQSIHKKLDDNSMSLRRSKKVLSDSTQYTGKDTKAFQIENKELECNKDNYNKGNYNKGNYNKGNYNKDNYNKGNYNKENCKKKLNNNEIHCNDKIVNGGIRKTNLSVKNNGNSKDSTDRIVGSNQRNFRASDLTRDQRRKPKENISK
jgi:hypothetical protein